LLFEKIGYTFKDTSHLDIAFTHKSYANELQVRKVPSYERYEFLGDAILQFISSKELILRYPNKVEGELSKLRSSLVCEQTLSLITRNLGFGRYMYLSNGEKQTGGRDRSSILCDMFESVLGAIYLDGGLEPAEAFVKRFLLTDIEKKIQFVDSKSRLQEYAQKHNLELLYEVIAESGPEHNKTYTVQVSLGGVIYETGTGHNKKSADQDAAYKTIIKLQN